MDSTNRSQLLQENSHENAEFVSQALAKYQQVAEKSVKAMVSAIVDIGITFMTITPSHVPSKEIDALRNLKRTIHPSTAGTIARILTDKRCNAILTLCQIAPKYPEKGQSFPRNTEYPFQDAAGWIAPVSEGVFSVAEVEDARTLTWVLHHQVIKFVSAARRNNV